MVREAVRSYLSFLFSKNLYRDLLLMMGRSGDEQTKIVELVSGWRIRGRIFLVVD